MLVVWDAETSKRRGSEAEKEPVANSDAAGKSFAFLSAMVSNGRDPTSGVVHADIKTPGWTRQNDLYLGMPFEASPAPNGLNTLPPHSPTQNDQHGAVYPENDEDMTDLAFLRRHENLAMEERSRWAGHGGGRGTGDAANPKSTDVARKRNRANNSSRAPKPLFPTPMECYEIIEEAKERQKEATDSIHATEKLIRKRRRALSVIELPVQALANIEGNLQREQNKLKKALKKVRRERERLGTSKRDGMIRVLDSGVNTLEATENTFAQASIEFMNMIGDLATRAKLNLTEPITFTSVHKDLIAVRHEAEIARAREAEMSLGSFIKDTLNRHKFPELHKVFHLRNDYQLEGQQAEGTGSPSDALTSSAENEVYGIMKDHDDSRLQQILRSVTLPPGPARSFPNVLSANEPLMGTQSAETRMQTLEDPLTPSLPGGMSRMRVSTSPTIFQPAQSTTVHSTHSNSIQNFDGLRNDTQNSVHFVNVFGARTSIPRVDTNGTRVDTNGTRVDTDAVRPDMDAIRADVNVARADLSPSGSIEASENPGSRPSLTRPTFPSADEIIDVDAESLSPCPVKNENLIQREEYNPPNQTPSIQDVDMRSPSP